MLRVDKETLFYPLNTNTEEVKVLFIFLNPPSSKVPIKRSLPTYSQGYISEILPCNTVVFPWKDRNNFRETWRGSWKINIDRDSSFRFKHLSFNWKCSQVLVTRQQVQTTGWISVKSAQTSHFCYCYFPGISRRLWPRRAKKKPRRCNEPDRIPRTSTLIVLSALDFPGKLHLQRTEDVESI